MQATASADWNANAYGRMGPQRFAILVAEARLLRTRSGERPPESDRHVAELEERVHPGHRGLVSLGLLSNITGFLPVYVSG